MAVQSTGYLNPTSAVVVSGSVSNINNILNSNEVYCESNSTTTAGLIRLKYNIPALNKFTKSKALLRLRHQQAGTASLSTVYPIIITHDLTGSNVSKTPIQSQSSATTTDNSSAGVSVHTNLRNSLNNTGIEPNMFYVRYYLYQYNLQYILGSIGSFTLINPLPEAIGLGNSFNVDLTCNYSIYTNEEVVFNYTLPNSFKIKNINFNSNNTSIFEYITHDSVNKQIRFKLKNSFLQTYFNSISSEYTNQFKINFTLTTDSDYNVPTGNILTITQPDLNIISNITLPQIVFNGFSYTGTKTKINNLSRYIIFEDSDIMPTSKHEVFMDNLDLLAFTKSRLHDIPTNDFNNSLSTNYGENKGVVQSLFLDSNDFTLVLFSKFNRYEYDKLMDVISELSVNFKTNIRLKLGVLPNKIILCNLKSIPTPEIHDNYSYITLDFEKSQRTPYNHYSISNVQNNQFVVNNYQREPAIITIKGSGSSCNLSITDQDGTQEMTINHSFNSEIIVDSKINKVYVDKTEIEPDNLTYKSEFFELKGKCTATINNGSIFKVVI